jgi:YVTN family beta-propeller protein
LSSINQFTTKYFILKVSTIIAISLIAHWFAIYSPIQRAEAMPSSFEQNYPSQLGLDNNDRVPGIRVGKTPTAISIDQYEMIFVANYESSTISVIDGSRDKVVDNIEVGENPTGIHFGLR